MKLRIGSVCTGYGGLDAAVTEVLGGELAWVADNDKGAAAILAHRFPALPNFGDITEIDWAAVEPVDIVTAGFPCQDVSCAGARAGLREGTRTGVWSHVARAIKALRPPLVILENVGGLLSESADSDMEFCPWCLGDADPESAMRALGAVLADLAEAGFDAEWRCVRASDAGAPHRRERVFIAAWPAADAPGNQPGRDGAIAGVDRRETGNGSRAGDRSTPADACGRELQRRGVAGVLAGPERALAGPGDQRERDGDAAAGRGPAAQDPDSAASSERREPAPGQAPGGRPRADAGGSGGARALAGVGSAGLAVGEVEPDGSQRPAAERGSSESAADPERDGRPGRQPGGTREADEPGQGPRAAAEGCCPDAAAADAAGNGRDEMGAWSDRDGISGEGPALAWGAYEAAIRRWEAVLGRPAPRPVEPGRTGGRLSPAFVEWLMGIPEGWVTDVPGLSRNQQLHALGNGVVPQQAAMALRYLLAAIETAGEAA